MGYVVEQYRKSDGELMYKLHEAEALLCEVMEELEGKEDMERNYRMNRRSNYRGRFDY